MKFVNLSVDIVTKDRLEEVRHELETSVRRNPAQYPSWMRGCRLSLHDTIVWMMDQRDKHKQRRKASKRNWPGGTVSIPDTMETPTTPDAE